MFCYNDPILRIDEKHGHCVAGSDYIAKEEFEFSNNTAGGKNNGNNSNGSNGNGNSSNGNKGSPPKDSLGLNLAAADAKVMRAALGMGSVFLVYIL